MIPHACPLVSQLYKLRATWTGYWRNFEERQLLVASPGQQPNMWLDWENVRDMLLDLDEYVIVAARAAADSPPLSKNLGTGKTGA